MLNLSLFSLPFHFFRARITSHLLSAFKKNIYWSTDSSGSRGKTRQYRSTWKRAMSLGKWKSLEWREGGGALSGGCQLQLSYGFLFTTLTAGLWYSTDSILRGESALPARGKMRWLHTTSLYGGRETRAENGKGRLQKMHLSYFSKKSN